MQQPITLLAPARDIHVARAAIQAGADAIYIGAPKFGARQAAGNSLDNLRKVVEEANRFGVRVMVTLNTLLHDNELDEAVELAWNLYNIDVYAILIQDLRLLERNMPPIRLHASTQCDNRTPEQVLRLQAMGFKCAVLARELSLDEIRAIKKAVDESGAEDPIELESFVHGALCVCYSGRCMMSEVMMGRSANRGECAQMCRMRYDLLDEDGKEIIDDRTGKPIHQKYVLSLQDMDRSAYIRELYEAGITTFKIEGRLKDADYVTNIVAYYHQLIQDMPCVSHYSQYEYNFTPNPQKTFHRGATDYFLHGRTVGVSNWDTPKSTGEKIGTVEAIRRGSILIKTVAGVTLNTGDGLTFADQGFAVNNIEGGWITPNRMPETLHPGQVLYRNQDREFIGQLKATRRILVDILFKETEKGFMIRIGNNEQEFEYVHEPANNPERAIMTINEQLSKLGDTIYVVGNIKIESKPYFIPISTINQWRRSVMNL